jgi:hypothetical protein
MGTSGRTNQTLIADSKLIQIPKIFLQISKSICKIIIENNIGTGFLIKFLKGEENFYGLMSCEHVITKKLIEKKSKITFFYDNSKKMKEFELDTSKRYIKDFQDINIDATIVEILTTDNIIDDYFLLPNFEFMENLGELNNKLIQIFQYPNGENLGSSEGEIIKIEKKEITHKAGTKEGSSGSPLFIKGTTGVIGIHKAEDKDKEEGYADFIGPIYKFFRNGLVYDNISEHSEVSSEETENEFKNNNFFPICLNDSYHPLNFDVEVLKINFKSEITLKCKDHHIYQMSLKEYFEKIKDIKIRKCQNLHYNEEKEAEFYCCQTNQFFCQNCYNILIRTNFNKSNFINIKDLPYFCLRHNKKLTIYCSECEKNICEICCKQFHKFHNLHDKSKIEKNEITKARNIIKEKMINLQKMKEFYEMIKSAYECHMNNNIYKKNLINVGQSVIKEEMRDEYDDDLAFYKIKQLKNGIKNANNNLY